MGEEGGAQQPLHQRLSGFRAAAALTVVLAAAFSMTYGNATTLAPNWVNTTGGDLSEVGSLDGGGNTISVSDSLDLNGNNLTNSPALRETADYIVFKEDGKIKAKNTIGHVEFIGTDAASVINDSIKAKESGQNTVFISKADTVYNFTETLAIKRNNTHLTGNLPKIKLAKNVDSDVIKMGDGTNEYENIEISYLWINGTKQHNTASGCIRFHSDFFTVTDSSAHHNRVTNCDLQGINMDSPSHAAVYANEIQNAGSQGIWMESVSNTVVYGNSIHDNAVGIGSRGMSRNQIYGNMIIDNDNHGLAVNGSENYFNNEVRFNGGNGIVIEKGGGNGYNTIAGVYKSNDENGIKLEKPGNTVDSAIVSGNGKHGIDVTGQYNTIIGGVSRQNDLNGIRLRYPNQKVIGITLEDNDQDNSGNHGIWAYNADNSLIHGVTARDTQGTSTQDYGVKVEQFTSDLVIKDLSTAGHEQDGIDDSGTGTVKMDGLTATMGNIKLNNNNITDVWQIGGGGDAVEFTDSVDVQNNDVQNIQNLNMQDSTGSNHDVAYFMSNDHLQIEFPNKLFLGGGGNSQDISIDGTGYMVFETNGGLNLGDNKIDDVNQIHGGGDAVRYDDGIDMQSNDIHDVQYTNHTVQSGNLNTCDSSYEGATAYNGTHWGCDGSSWNKLY